jgi:hypothetical protein
MSHAAVADSHVSARPSGLPVVHELDDLLDLSGPSVKALAPKAAAMSSSRTSPVTRETRVSRETVDAALSRLTGGSVARL